MLRRLRDIPFQIKMILQRITRGYSDLEWWDLDSHCSRWILPRLRHLATHGHGYHTDTPEEWQQILSDLIYFHEIVTKGDQGMPGVDMERYERGQQYWGQYYSALWD